MASQADAARRKGKDSALHGRSFLFKGKTLFVFCTLVGSVSIFASEPIGLPFILGVIIPIGLMGVYLFIGLNGFVDTIDTETFADSVYYMGFLFTLISLSAALFYLRNDDPSLNVLVAKFGLALLTTIVGLSARVTLVNFRIRGNQARQVAEERLSTAVERFASDLELTCDKLEVLLNGIVEKVEMTSNDVTNASNQAAEAIASSSNQNQEVLREMYDGAATKWTEAVDQILTEVRQSLSSAVTHAANQISGIGEQIGNKISKFKIDEDVFSKPLEKPLEELAHTIRTARVLVAKEFGALHDASKDHQKISQQFERLGEALEAGQKSIHALDQYAQDLSKAFSELNEVDTGLSALGTQSSDVSESFRHLSETARSTSASFAADVQASRDSFSQLQRSLNTIIDAIAEQSKEMRSLVERISVDAEQGRTSLRSVQDNLVESANAIVRHLK